ncbi:MAG: CoA-binding protein [Fimbriiglobus sp.]
MPSVAIVGASPDRRKIGNKAVRAHLAGGWTVYPVHPTEATIEGVPAFRSVRDIPAESLDRVTFYVVPAVGLKVLPDVATKRVGSLILNPGTDAPEVLAKAVELGLPATAGCSIILGGFRPEQFPDE